MISTTFQGRIIKSQKWRAEGTWIIQPHSLQLNHPWKVAIQSLFQTKNKKLKNKDKVLVHLGEVYCFQTPWEKYSFQNFQVMKSKKQINIQKSYKL